MRAIHRGGHTYTHARPPPQDTLKAFAAQKAQEAADIKKKMQEREEQLQSRIRQLEQQLEAAQHRASSSDVPAVHPPAQQQGTALTQQHTNHSLLDEMAAERDKSAQHHEEQLTRMAAELRTTANTVNEALQAMQVLSLLHLVSP